MLSIFHHNQNLRLLNPPKWRPQTRPRPQPQLLLHLATLVIRTQPPSSSSKSLNQTKQSHAHALITGLLPQCLPVSATLILNYANNGHHSTSRRLFKDSVNYSRTAFFWNTLIRAYSIAGVDSGLGVYNTMITSGVKVDSHTFPFVINACSKFSQFRKGVEVHGVVVKLGFEEDIFVGNTLLLFYGEIRDIKSVEKVFDEMFVRDAVSWNTIIGVCAVNGCNAKAIHLFYDMRLRFGLKPNVVSIISVLPVCAVLEDKLIASEIHCYVMKVGLYNQLNVGNALIDVYGKCRNMVASKRVFDEMVEKSEVSWNAMITSYTYNKCSTDALGVLRLMIDAGEKPNGVAISSILPVCVELESFDMGREIHGFTIRMGEYFDVFIINSLIDLYAKSRKFIMASNLFYRMGTRNIVTWNAMIANLAQNRLELAAISLIREMQDHGEVPDSVTFTNVLPACARLGSPRPGKELHAWSIRFGSSSDLFVSNGLTDMYAQCGCLNLARNVFNMSFKDQVSYNILITAYSQTSNCLESLNLFTEMALLGLNHDVVSFVGALSACANLSYIKQGKEIHGISIRKLFHTHLFIANSLSDLYTKCGRINLAREIFNRIPHKDAASWNTMILGYGMLGEVDTAMDLFKAMKKDAVEYDSISFIVILSVCSHNGLVEEGKKYFNEMKERDIEPQQMHYACMVDLLGRAGLMDEAAEFIKGLSIEPDSNVWGALLGACGTHGNLELAAWAAEHLFKLQPDHCGYYIRLANMYAEAGRWDEADKVRELMKFRGVNKSPSCSWVQIGDRVHAFGVGERMRELNSCYQTG